MVVIIYGNNGDELPKLGSREDFAVGGGRHNNICLSRSVVVGRETQWRRGPCQRLGYNTDLLLLIPAWNGGILYQWRKRRLKGKLMKIARK